MDTNAVLVRSAGGPAGVGDSDCVGSGVVLASDGGGGAGGGGGAAAAGDGAWAAAGGDGSGGGDDAVSGGGDGGTAAAGGAGLAAKAAGACAALKERGGARGDVGPARQASFSRLPFLLAKLRTCWRGHRRRDGVRHRELRQRPRAQRRQQLRQRQVARHDKHEQHAGEQAAQCADNLALAHARARSSVGGDGLQQEQRERRERGDKKETARRIVIARVEAQKEGHCTEHCGQRWAAQVHPGRSPKDARGSAARAVVRAQQLPRTTCA